MYAVMFYVILNKRKLHFPLAKNVMHSPSIYGLPDLRTNAQTRIFCEDDIILPIRANALTCVAAG